MPQVEIAGVYTLESSRGQELCGRYGGKNYQSLQSLAEDPSVDLVSIATPENLHLEPFRVLAMQGKAVYVEKPLSTSLEEARLMRDLAQSIPAMSGHCLHFEPHLALLFEKLDGVRKHHLKFSDRRRRAEKATYGRVHPAYAMLCHEVELSNAFAGSPFELVIALETRFSEGQVDGISMLIEYENGVTSSVEGGWYLPSQKGVAGNDHFSILSEAGLDEFEVPELGYFSLTESGLEVPNLHYGHSVYGLEYGPLRSALDYMVECVCSGVRPKISTIQDAYSAVELIEGALRSVCERRWVTRSELVPSSASGL